MTLMIWVCVILGKNMAKAIEGLTAVLKGPAALLAVVKKENKAAGVLDNFEEGKKYAQHSLRKFVRRKRPEVMPSLNKFFTDPK